VFFIETDDELSIIFQWRYWRFYTMAAEIIGNIQHIITINVSVLQKCIYHRTFEFVVKLAVEIKCRGVEHL